jgi:hypothetical protein
MQNRTGTTHLVHIFNEGKHEILDVFGPTVQFLAKPEEADETLFVLKGVIPPGGCSHAQP